MARRDELTNKGPQFGNRRSKALNATSKKWNCNLQHVRIKTKTGAVRSVKISTRTKRTLRKKGLLA